MSEVVGTVEIDPFALGDELGFISVASGSIASADVVAVGCGIGTFCTSVVVEKFVVGDLVHSLLICISGLTIQTCNSSAGFRSITVDE
jgi:hypothetical protein